MGQLGGSPPICITSDSSSNIFFPAVGGATVEGIGGSHMQLYSEMEALQLSRSDNPFVRQSQDNLDAISLAREAGLLWKYEQKCHGMFKISGGQLIPIFF